MLLLSLWGHLLMIKRQTVTACNGRWRKRKNSAIRSLVAETLVLAKTHGYVEKIEDELERELARDISDPPQEKIQRWRREGDKIFKSKHVLLTVVILCVLDCALVLGELALDLYKVKGTLEFTYGITKSTQSFMQHMKSLYPYLLSRSPYEIFNLILESTVIFSASLMQTNASDYSNISVETRAPCASSGSSWNTSFAQERLTANKTVLSVPSFDDEEEDYNLLIIEKIAHIFHYCSIAILAIILLETALKAVCAGRSFFHRKLEVFDAFIVTLSLLVDLMFLAFFPDIDTKDFIFILAILLPWRVIRVVNSLAVSVKDHEHFRLKLVYKRKKKIQSNLRDTEAMLQKYMTQVTTLQRLCIMEGIEEWKIDNYLKNDEISVTPNKKKFRFKMDDSLFHMQGHNRAPRCSMPSLDFRGLKLPSNANVSKSRISLPAVANTIKQHLSKTSRRASLAAIELYNTKITNGDVKKKKFTSEDLTTMHEEDDDDTHDSALSSRATSESGDVFSRISCSDSIGSDRTVSVTDSKSKTRHNSEIADSDKEDKDKLAKIQEEAKRRHSESILDKGKLQFGVSSFSNDVVTFTNQNGKTYTKPFIATETLGTEGDKGKGIKCDRSEKENNSVIKESSAKISNENIAGKDYAKLGTDNNNDTSVRIDIDKEDAPEQARDTIQTANTTEIVMEEMSNGTMGVRRTLSENGKCRERWV